MTTSNEWMQKAGNLEHEIDRLQRDLQEAQLRALKAEGRVRDLQVHYDNDGAEIKHLRAENENLRDAIEVLKRVKK